MEGRVVDRIDCLSSGSRFVVNDTVSDICVVCAFNM